MFAAASHTGFEEAVSFAVRCGGDTDTLGAMAGALAGAAFGSTSIPARWLDALENGHRGRRYVERLVGALLAATAVPQ
jgi:ADP-ribosyl-[dinitrogen reductase] hydrolase